MPKPTLRHEFNNQKRQQKARNRHHISSLIEIKNPDYINNQGFQKKIIKINSICFSNNISTKIRSNCHDFLFL